jgi:hypothetical protein
VAPTGKFFGDAGVTTIEDNDITVSFMDELVIPDILAVMLVVPTATLVAVPKEFMVTIAVLLLNHATSSVTSELEPSE